MSRNRHLINRIMASMLIVFGVVFGGTWNSKRFCLGDHIFSALGLPIWSNGTSGTHYPAMVGAALVLIGVGVLNSTLQKRTRRWGWMIAVLVLVVLNYSLA